MGFAVSGSTLVVNGTDPKPAQLYWRPDPGAAWELVVVFLREGVPMFRRLHLLDPVVVLEAGIQRGEFADESTVHPLKV